MTPRRILRALAMRVLERATRNLDSGEKFDWLRELGGRILPGYRFKWPQMQWWWDARFNAYLDRFGERAGMNTDRRFMVSQLLRLVDGVPGDTAEAGVFAGAGSYLICAGNARSRVGRRHHVFDSFEGLSEPSTVDGEHWEKGNMAVPLEDVRATLASFPEVEFHKGWIPERFHEAADRTFAFVHIDVDLYEPTRDSLQFFYPRMADGGIIVCDDYGFTTCPGATRAVDEFLRDKDEKMIGLSAGGGFLIKGCLTGAAAFDGQAEAAGEVRSPVTSHAVRGPAPTRTPR